MAKQAETKTKTAAELRAEADACAKQASALRAEARKQARVEKRAAEKRAADKLARDEIAAFQYSKNMTVKNGDSGSRTVYDWVMESYRRSPEYVD